MYRISDNLRCLIGYDPFPRHEKFTRPEQLDNLNTARKLFEGTPEPELKREFDKHYKSDFGDKFFQIAKDLYQEKITSSKAQSQWDMLKIEHIKEKGTSRVKEPSPFLTVTAILKKLSRIINH